jgi:serine/threonine protein kinase
MTITTSWAFLMALEESGLLEPDQTVAAREVATRASDPREAALTLVQLGVLTRWQAGQLIAGRPSFRVGPYRLIDLLGRGGMGSVFLARHTMMNRSVALKMIARKLGGDPAALERFLTEARAVASLDHPNIVHAYNVDCEGDRYYMVLEYVEGQDLQRMVESGGPLPFDKAADYVRQAAEGLAHAHAKRLVHCDVKPANLLVNSQGVVKVLDMGMARWAEDKPAPSAPGGPEGAFFGTVDYLAPEQALNSPDLDHRADLYSLGCTLYFLLVGHPPFPEGTMVQRILKHQTQQPAGILAQRPDTPRDLVRICNRLMAKSPDERFQTASEVARALATWRPNAQRVRKAVALPDEEEGPPEAPEDSPPASVKTNPRRGLPRWAWLSAVAIAAVVLTTIGGVWAVNHRGRGPTVANGETKPPKVRETKPVVPAPHGEKFVVPNPLPPANAEMPVKDPPKVPPEGQPASAKVLVAVSPAAPQGNALPKEVSPPKEKSQVAAAPAKPKPELPPPDVDPFAGLPAAVDLPDFVEEVVTEGFVPEAAALTPLRSAPGLAWTMELLGGDEILKGGRKFTLATRPDAPGPEWVVRLESTGKEAVDDIARLWIDRDALMFQWLPDATAPCNSLRNCLLDIRSGGRARALALRRPAVVEPLAVSLERTAIETVVLESSPDSSRIYLEVLKFEGREGCLIQPRGPQPIKAPISLVFAQKSRVGRDVPSVELRFNALSRRPKFQIDLRLYRPKELAPLHASARTVVEEHAKKLKQEADGAKSDPKKLLSIEPQLDMSLRQLWYDDFYKGVHEKATLHYRVFALIGEKQVELVRTVAKKPEAGAKPQP